MTGRDVRIRRGLELGALTRTLELHVRFYCPTFGLGVAFEAAIARGLADFAQRYDAERDGQFLASAESAAAARPRGEIVGSLTLDGSGPWDDGGAKIRWVILDESFRGSGIGRRLLDASLELARGLGYRRLFLDTFAELRAARALYDRAGFREVAVQRQALWGTEIDVQRLELRLD